MTTTNQQVIRLRQMIHKYNKEGAAAKSGMSSKTARKYLSLNTLPSELKKDRYWKTRTNAFQDNWLEIEDMLSKSPTLQAKTILEYLISKDNNKFSYKHERTLQRLIRKWKANNGKDKEVIFSQELKPGKQSQSDYTVMNEVKVTIDGKQFDHMLFHFMLPYSRWECATICYSESFESLSKGYEEAVWSLGFVAHEHRTDNLTAATQAFGSRRAFTKRWQEVMDHYGVIASRNNPGVSHENGSIEKSHDLLKTAIKQQLMLRGSNNFGNIIQYQQFINQLVANRNFTRTDRLNEELKILKPLPNKKYYAPLIIEVRVSKFSTVRILKSVYSVPSRLIGYNLRAYVYQGEIKLYYGQTLVQTMPQSQGNDKAVVINYRHLITSLLRKPGAFANYYYKDCFFPNANFRTSYDLLIEQYPVNGTKQYLQILNLTTSSSEAEVSLALELLITSNIVPTFEQVQDLLKSSRIPIPKIQVYSPSLNDYNSLLTMAI